ncbi:GAF domain-containing sensor histidine kinase [Leptolyngbya sp. NK1-12]|uniref:histidine kinase n=1 Tax=Leptolyngbya sp. NK1-12 TaxID=2547451 RepID=A0AA96WI11_9CYAN|nr:GAF domain-containing sensor histidine kinase [Leptolyngbya sp. NK1-12]WNZ25479.1 GAF domain-containing sensor histidine kinase [Leptolyngbya sp. NK1-12]
MNSPDQEKVLGFKRREIAPSRCQPQTPDNTYAAGFAPSFTAGRELTEKGLLQQLEQEQLINKIALQIFQASDLSYILNLAVTEIRRFLQADRVLIERYHKGESLAVAESVEPSYQSCLGKSLSSLWSGSRLKLYQQGLNEVVAQLEPVHEFSWQDLLQAQARLAIPILRNQELWGVLAVHQCSHPRNWQPDEIDLLEQLTTRLAIAIHHSELHHEIQRLNDHLESEVQARTAQLQQAYEFEATLKRITDRVRDSLDVDLILQAAIRELAIVMGVRACNASLYDLEQGTSTTCYEYTSFLSPYQGRVAKFSTTQELYSQLLRGECFQFCSLIPNPERGMVAALACPILDDQGVIGDLWVLHHKDHAFSEQDIRLVKQVANQCSIAIRQANLYAKVQEEVKTLERLNQLKDDFLSTVSHELRTPLSNIKMAIHMLRTAPNPERQQRYLQILEAECSRETELINDLLDLQRLENDSYRVSPEPILLQEWLPSIMAPFLSRAQSRQQHLQIDLPSDTPEIITDRKSLERILAELLNNACKYTSPDGSIALTVQHTAAANPNQLKLHLTNMTQPVAVTTFVIRNEADIPATEIPRMFEKFYRIPKSDPWQQGGTGLGLALIKKLVETLHGSIEAESRDGWTILTVHLPMLEADGH